jgi:hypothetical protein
MACAALLVGAHVKLDIHAWSAHNTGIVLVKMGRTLRMKRIKGLAGWLGGTLLACAAWGQVPPVSPATPAQPMHFIPSVSTATATDAHGKSYAVLTVNQTPAASIRTSAGGYTPLQRAGVAARRLSTLLQGGMTPQELSVQPDVKPDWEVAARGGVLLMATPQEAAAHGMTPKDLARSWTLSLRTLLAEPGVTLSVPSLIVPLGEMRTVKIGGAIPSSEVRVQDDNGAIALLLYDPNQHTLTVRGRATGSDTVTVSPAPGIGGTPLTLPVTVMPYAGQVSPSVSVEVTGSPAPSSLVAQAAYLGLTHAVTLENGAQAILDTSLPSPMPLAVNGQITEAFPLHLSGSGLLPLTAQPRVTVVNTAVFAHPPTALLYSNNPEQVKREQTLFTGDILSRETVRLDFHHQNQSGTLLAFHIDLVNNGDAPTSVQVIAGLSLPGADTVQVGRRAGAAFLQNLNANDGLILTVPPHSHIPVVTQRFAPGLTVSGLMQIQNLTDGALSLSVHADADTDVLASALWRIYMAGTSGNALAAPSDALGPMLPTSPSPQVFPDPQITLSGSYTVNGPWAFLTLGSQDALHAQSGRGRLYGNYGADYDITVTLINPTQVTRTIALYFRPNAGPAAGIFQINAGPIQEYDPFSPPDERLLATEILSPGETRVVHLHTIPLNGSAYPAKIVAHALDLSPAQPPPTAVAVDAAGKPGH